MKCFDLSLLQVCDLILWQPYVLARALNNKQINHGVLSLSKLVRNSKAIGKVVFTGVIVVLLVAMIALGFVMSNTINSLQTEKTSLQSQITSLQSNNSQLQSNYNSLQSQFTSLQSNYNLSQTQIASLQSQLSNATALIAQLQGPTGILPTYMDLGYVGPYPSGGAYFLQLSLKNTGTVPITQIFVTLNSVQITMTFTYLNTTVSAGAPLPSYQTTTGSQNVTPPISGTGTYPLIIQALATDGTIYTYQTTIIGHV
jgi:cell division protein FtsL